MTTIHEYLQFALRYIILVICLIHYQGTFAQEIQHLDVTTSSTYTSVKGEHKLLWNKHFILHKDIIVALKKGKEGYVIQHFDTTNLTLTYTSAPIQFTNDKFCGLKLMAVNDHIYFIGYEPISKVIGSTEIQHPTYLLDKYAQEYKQNWRYWCYAFDDENKSINATPKIIRGLSSIECLRVHDKEKIITSFRRTNFDSIKNEFEYVVDFYNLDMEIYDSLKLVKQEELVDYKIINNSLKGIIIDHSKESANTSIVNYDISNKKITRTLLEASLGSLVSSKLLVTRDRMFIVSMLPNLLTMAPFERTVYKPSSLILVELDFNGTLIKRKEFEIRPFETYSKRGTSGSEIEKMNIDKIEVENGHIFIVLSHLIKDGSSYTPYAMNYPFGSSLIVKIPTTDLGELHQMLIHKTQLFMGGLFDVGNFVARKGESLQFFYVDYIKKHPKKSDIYYCAKPNGSGLVGYQIDENGALTPFIAFDKQDINGLKVEAFSPQNMIQLGNKVVVEVALKGGKENTWITIQLN